jgi:hypothetical protein
MVAQSYSTQLRVASLSTTDSCPVPDQPPLPPTALGLSLLEIFFSRIYNASLLFHKPILFQQYLTGEIHGALLKALLALATLYVLFYVFDALFSSDSANRRSKVPSNDKSR